MTEPIKETTITYKRVKNLGNYQSESLEISTTVAHGQNLDEAIDKLKRQVLSHLGIGSVDEQPF